jgi:hypothetical protein
MGRPRKKPEPEMYVAIETGVSLIDGKNHPYYRGKTRVRKGHPLLEAVPAYFRPIDAHYDIEEIPAPPLERERS